MKTGKNWFSFYLSRVILLLYLKKKLAFREKECGVG